MPKAIRAALCVWTLFCAGLPAMASTPCALNTFPNWDGNTTVGWLATAQTVVAPPSCPVLLEYEFALAGRSSPGNVQFSIYAWGPSGPIGAPLFTTTLSWGTSQSTYVISNINLTLTPGARYGADIDLLGYSDSSVLFSHNTHGYHHDGWWYNGSWIAYPASNHLFRAKWGQ